MKGRDYLIILILLAIFSVTGWLIYGRFSESFEIHNTPLNLDQYRNKAYEQISVQTLQQLCYNDREYCFKKPKNTDQFQRSVKTVAKDSIMHAIQTNDYYYLLLLLLKINSLEMAYQGYENCVYFHNNAYGTAIVTSILATKDSLRKLTLLRVGDMLKVFNNDAFRLESESEITHKINELGLNKEDGDNYRIFYKKIVRPLLNDPEFIDHMNNNQTEDMPLILFAKYGTAVILSNYLFNKNDEKCDI